MQFLFNRQINAILDLLPTRIETYFSCSYSKIYHKFFIGGSELNNNSLKTEEICCEMEISKDADKSNCSKPGEEDTRIPNDISTACQTEDAEPAPCHFYEELKKVEERMSNEKEQQIKWIENEIKHLNMLRRYVK